MSLPKLKAVTRTQGNNKALKDGVVRSPRLEFDFADVKSEDELKYGSFLIEAMHSLLSKYYGLYHPFQTVAEQIFVRDKEDGDFSVTDELHLKFVDAEQPKT